MRPAATHRLAEREGLVLVAGADDHQGQLAPGHLGEPRRRVDQPHQVLPRLEVGDREQVRNLGGKAQVVADPVALVRRGRLEEQVVRRVGYIRHPAPTGREGLQQLLGVEPRDRQDQVGLLEDAGHQLALPRRVVAEELQDVMAGHRPAGLPRRHEELGRAIDPVERPGPPLDRRPRLDPPPSQQVAGPQRQLATRGELERLPERQPVRVLHPAGQEGQRDLRPSGQPVDLGQRVAGHAGRGMAGVHVVEQRDAQGRLIADDGGGPVSGVFVPIRSSPSNIRPPAASRHPGPISDEARW